ncbi:uncharacterized protein MELLADRAFT_62458 [Melampsora larici-populina 98AG31]|uniref:Uncharacterized protein n=1 Tax=Melampsora larici-populina (strain 98AG31 / pathotype 3-4-7) TaxID=747676 RepID=F4RJ16_MELLP|nr:uncharacterized protein MELLADRAFT_62458 [Melampsora larici-populina 98AG31]EGG07655.1 hypothetical protein MELLADRAFT_62458 [Melampsora larici-populina 98AG31]
MIPDLLQFQLTLSISADVAISMNPSLPKISKLNVDEIQDAVSSLQTGTREVQRKEYIGKHQKTLTDQKQHEDVVDLAYQPHNWYFPKQAHRFHNGRNIHKISPYATPDIETHITVGPVKNNGEINRAQVGQQRPRSKSRLISNLLSSQGSESYVQNMSDGNHGLKCTPANSNMSTDNLMIGSSKRQKITGNQNKEAGNLVLGHQALDEYFPKQAHRSFDKDKMQNRYDSVGTKVKKPLPIGAIESQGALPKGKLEFPKPVSKGNQVSEWSRSKGSTSHIQNMIDGNCAIEADQIQLKQARTDQTPKKDPKGINQKFQPHVLQMPPKPLKKMSPYSWESKEKYAYKGKTKLANNPKLTCTSVKRMQGINIQTFYSHNPDKMCSAAAYHFTKDLLTTMKIKYQPQTKQTNYPTWEAAKQMWTPNLVLPFVYFVVSCNPTLRIWENIKHMTAYILKCYNQWYATYHIAQLGSKIKSPQGETTNLMSRQLTVSGLSTLARNLLVIHEDDALKTFMCHSKARLCMLKRHVSETFEGDYSKGYPYTSTNQKQAGSVWDDWEKKSLDIRKKAEDVQWPTFLDYPRSDSEQILLVNGEPESNILVKENNRVAAFIHQWEMDFMKTIKFIRTSHSQKSGFPPLSIKDFCRGIHTFLNENNPTPKYQVTLFSEFLHQDSQDKFYADFWNHFEVLEDKKLTQALRQRKSIAKIGKKALL